jgi:DNA (cytosine-5)-methyltransferase 1
LSPKACAGILRRAAKRGKALPEALERALRAVAESGVGFLTDFEVAGGLQPFTFDGSQSDNPKATHQYTEDGSPPLIKSRPYNVASPTMAVRRLLPVECERLQGFPDGWTEVPWRGKPAPDGPRYKAMGNSMAVPVMRFIGQRFDALVKGTL